MLGLFCSVCNCGSAATEGSMVMEVTEEGVNDDEDASNTEYSNVEECDEGSDDDEDSEGDKPDDELIVLGSISIREEPSLTADGSK